MRKERRINAFECQIAIYNTDTHAYKLKIKRQFIENKREDRWMFIEPMPVFINRS